MGRRSRTAALTGAVLGSVAAGIAAGAVVERLAVGRQRLRPDPEAREPFGRLPGRERTVVADDGVRLHVEEVGAGDVTVIFCHGFALSLASWHYQRRDLVDVGRLVFYDHRSHGRSQRGGHGTETLDQLGRDLATILDAVAPSGPVVLVGHSMGGMTIMSLAHQRPELFGTRIVGAVLVATEAGNVTQAFLPLPVRASGLLTGRLLPHADRFVRRRATVVERARRVGSDFAFLVTRLGGFGPDASPAQIEFTERMIAATPLEVITAFVPTFVEHDKFEALGVVGRVPTLVIGGERDRITPVHQSRAIAAHAPGAELVLLDGAGHMVMLERAPLVNLHLRAFIRRVSRGARGGRRASRGA